MMRYKIIFANKTLLALALLEIHTWGLNGRMHKASVADDSAVLWTQSADIVDVVTESFEHGRQYTIEKQPRKK